jgi:putative membrane protein
VVTIRRTILRRAGALAALASLALSPLGPPAAVADDAITQQGYADLLNLKELHAKGYTGKGVTIAYMEAKPDLQVPELAGANIESREACPYQMTPSTIAHSTMVASILTNKDWGWAPEAKIVNYASILGASGDKELPDSPCKNDLSQSSNTDAQINRALSDGVDIISLSVTDLSKEASAPTIARAALLGVPIIAAGDNTGTEQNFSYGRLNTVVAVGFTNLEGKRSDKSSYGEHLTIMAPGEDINMRLPDSDGNLTELGKGLGSSASTPMVAGLLALGKQKWPKATGNQLIRSLINTANNNGQGWTKEYGWGLINPVKFLTEDPTSLEDTNPLWDKIPGAEPTQQTVADYQDGLIDPADLAGDSSYVYRGVDEAAVANDPDRSEFGTSPRYHK